MHERGYEVLGYFLTLIRQNAPWATVYPELLGARIDVHGRPFLLTCYAPLDLLPPIVIMRAMRGDKLIGEARSPGGMFLNEMEAWFGALANTVVAELHAEHYRRFVSKFRTQRSWP